DRRRTRCLRAGWFQQAGRTGTDRGAATRRGDVRRVGRRRMIYLANALSLLIQFAFGCAILLFVFRLLAEAVRADFYNPICQFLYRATNPVLTPLRRVIPTWRRINIAALLIAWVLEIIKNFLLGFVVPDFWASNVGVLVLSVA